jgi:hypothetical protein
MGPDFLEKPTKAGQRGGLARAFDPEVAMGRLGANPAQRGSVGAQRGIPAIPVLQAMTVAVTGAPIGARLVLVSVHGILPSNGPRGRSRWQRPCLERMNWPRRS